MDSLGLFQIEDFWKNFWPNFFSNIFSGIILTYLITLVIQKFNSPRLDIILQIASSVQNRKSLLFFCVNNGRTGLKSNEIQWHIYFDESFEFKRTDYQWAGTFYKDANYYEFSGMNDLPCLPGSSCLLLSIDVIVNPEKFPYDLVDEAPFYYSLTTIQGQKGKMNVFKRDKKDDFMVDLSHVKRRVFKMNSVTI